MMDALDEYRETRSPVINRPAAVRRILSEHLRRRSHLKPAKK
jgi:hypothetical protein